MRNPKWHCPQTRRRGETGYHRAQGRGITGSPKSLPHCVMRPLPDGLWATEGVDDELAPPESQWLVLPLADGGDVEDRDATLCWFMHWATAKPARQGSGVTTWEDTCQPGRRGATPPTVWVSAGQSPALQAGLGPWCEGHAQQRKPTSLKVCCQLPGRSRPHWSGDWLRRPWKLFRGGGGSGPSS